MVIKYISAGNGLRYREHPTKTTGVGRNKRPLRYYLAVYRLQGKTVTDAYGWEGEDFTHEADMLATVMELHRNRRNKTPPFTLKEKRALQQAKNEKQEKEKEQERLQRELDERSILDNVLEAYSNVNTQKKSLLREVQNYNKWIRPSLGGKQLDKIVLEDLERIEKKMLSEDKSPRTILQIKQLVRQLYNFAKKHKIYPAGGELPTKYFLEGLILDNKRERYLSVEEARLLLGEVRKHSESTYQICLMSLNTGARFGEIVDLRWQYINEAKRDILFKGKNGETRHSYMTDELLAMFREMPHGKPDALLFPAETGDGPEKARDAISDTFTRVVEKLGLNEGITDRRMKVVFHSLRHTCASWLINQGVALPVLAKILGHKTLSMTMRYSHVNDASVKSAMALLDKQQQPEEIATSIGQKR